MDPAFTHIATTSSGRELRLSPEERLQHAILLGGSGTGKSTTVERWAAQDAARGDGILLLDVAGTLAEAVLTHIPPWRHNHVCHLHVADVAYPVGWNVLEDWRPDARAVAADAVVSAMRAIHRESWGPRLELILRHSVSALIEVQGSLVLVPRLLTDASYRALVISRLKDPVTRGFFVNQFETWRDGFRDEAIVSVLNKVEAFLAFPQVRNILGQGRSTLHLEQAMQRGRIIIVNLAKSEIGETAAQLMGALLLGNLVSKLSLNQNRHFHVYIDEAHNFQTSAVATLLQEARKYSVSCTIAVQHLAALNEPTRAALLANTYSTICYRLGAEDAEFLAPSFDRAHQAFNPYVLQHLERGEAVVRIGNDDAHTVEMPPPLKGKANVATIKKQSRVHYARSRAAVELRIGRALGLD